MKKLILLALLLAPITAVAQDGEDEAAFQCYVACGETHTAPADWPIEKILELIEQKEAECAEEGEGIDLPETEESIVDDSITAP